MCALRTRTTTTLRRRLEREKLEEGKTPQEELE